MTREEAVRALTTWAAYAAHQDDELVSLEPGKRAEASACSGGDVFTCRGGDPDLRRADDGRGEGGGDRETQGRSHHRSVQRSLAPDLNHAYWTPMVSATRPGRSWPSISMVISEVTRTPPPATSSTLTSFWCSRGRAPGRNHVGEADLVGAVVHAALRLVTFRRVEANRGTSDNVR